MTTYYRTEYRKAFDILAYTYHADIYCVACGESLPDIDPEGNDKHPVFVCDEILPTESCGNCGEYID
tara:strand:+ start:953 stop:1153 length:201 start_codon:yes stop_codon:yes gene_type:complete